MKMIYHIVQNVIISVDLMFQCLEILIILGKLQDLKIKKKIFLKWLREKLGNLSVDTSQNSNESKLVIIEIGCGISLHSLRLEVELLAQRNDIDVIRINPQDFSVSNEKHMGIGKGSLEALVKIQEKLNQIKINKESDNNNN